MADSAEQGQLEASFDELIQRINWHAKYVGHALLNERFDERVAGEARAGGRWLRSESARCP